MRPEVVGFFHNPTFSVSYLVFDPAARRGFIIDPVLDYDHRSGHTSTGFADALLEDVRRRGIAIDWLLETHIHADHLSAQAYLKEKLGVPTAIGAAAPVVQATFKAIYNLGSEFIADGSQYDRLLAEGEHLSVGGLTVEVMATPGHTPACISYRVGDALFHGDTLFMPDYGTARCDFPGGDAATLYRSIRRILALAPGDAAVQLPRLWAERAGLRLGSHGGRAAPGQYPHQGRCRRSRLRGHAPRARQDIGGAGADPPGPSGQYPRRATAGAGIERHHLSEDSPQSDLRPIPGRSGERSAAASPVLRSSAGRSPVVTRALSAAPAAGEVWMP